MAIHLDHNATTPLRPEVRARWLEQLDALGGNPSSVHAAGRRARAVIDEARESVAADLGVAESEVVFTSGGTESNNAALFGALRALGPAAALVTTAGEHSSVLRVAETLRADGRRVVIEPIDAQGRPQVERLARTAREAAGEGRALLSVMTANNEVGSVTDLAALARALDAPGARRAVVHTDAVQALGRLPLDLEGWGVDLASFSLHKVGGPLGLGVLVRREGTPWEPLLHGGGQESGARPGTENAPAIAAGALAVALAVREQSQARTTCLGLSALFLRQLTLAALEPILLGPPLEDPLRLPNTLNLLFRGVEGRTLVSRLDLEGLETSAGSACASGSLEPSHVLLAMGRSEADARAGLRVSFSPTTSPQDVRDAVEILRRTLASIHSRR